MNNTLNINNALPGSTTRSTPGSAQGPNKRLNDYQSESVREVKARAATFRQEINEQDLRKVKQLTRFLEQGHPIEQNVPRGYYLNIQV